MYRTDRLWGFRSQSSRISVFRYIPEDNLFTDNLLGFFGRGSFKGRLVNSISKQVKESHSNNHNTCISIPHGWPHLRPQLIKIHVSDTAYSKDLLFICNYLLTIYM